MKIGTLFTGIEGFGLGFERAGFRIVWQIEIDKPCVRVLERHWPGVKRHGDIQTVDPGELEPVDIVCGGFPCQDLSVAGKRAGLDGARSGLFFEFMRIVAGLRPTWLVIENVPGLLSSNRGRDMGTVLGTLAQLGYGYAYRVLDAQYFGVAQRRRRVFIVGHLGEPWPAPAKVLFEPESCSGDPPPCREAGKEVAGTLTGGFGERGVDADQIANGNYAITAHSLTTRPGERMEPGSETYVIQDIVAHTLRSGGAGNAPSSRGENLVIDRVAGWVERDDKIFAYQKDARRSTAQELVFHKPSGCADSLTQQKQQVVSNMAVRRLTPLECERLQYFPDGWTEGESDSARYRMLGNSVAVCVIEWIARRMKAVMIE